VKTFELNDQLLPNTWTVVRIDGRGFHKFSDKYAFEKPNDRRALNLMNAAAKAVMGDMSDIVIAYGVSDEYSFVFHKSCSLFERRSSHINNLYNTTFWALVQQGAMNAKDAEKTLSGSLSAEKNEILFSRFKINYNNELELYKKGSVVFREYELVEPGAATRRNEDDESSTELSQVSKTQVEKNKKRRAKARIIVQHVDIIRDDFWDRRPWLLSNSYGKIPET